MRFTIHLTTSLYSPGIFALSLASKLPAGLVTVGDLKINIFAQQPRVQASVDVTLPFGESSVQVKAALKTESDIRLRETYESAEVMVSCWWLKCPKYHGRRIWKIAFVLHWQLTACLTFDCACLSFRPYRATLLKSQKCSNTLENSTSPT